MTQVHIPEYIRKMFPDAEDAIIFCNHAPIPDKKALGNEFTTQLFIEQNKEEYLAEAKRRHKAIYGTKGDGRTTIKLPGGVEVSAPSNSGTDSDEE